MMKQKQPNVVFIYADDLGRGMLSCYGQKWFETTNIDSICKDGMNFTNAHGCHICAPARASLMCGVHDSHCGKWKFTRAGVYKDYVNGILSLQEIYELIHNVSMDENSDGQYLATVFSRSGYHTAQIGKLDWGFSTTGDEVKSHGWDYHYGYYDHEMCHGHYPPFLFENGVKVDIIENEKAGADCGADHYSKKTFEINGNDEEKGRVKYAQDLFDQKIVQYLNEHKSKPFFLLHTSLLPHGKLSIPEINPAVKEINELNTSEKVYASMVLRLDQTVGLILSELKRLDLENDTIICFSSDNGHACYYNSQRTGFNPNYNIKGEKRDDFKIRFSSEEFADVFDGNNGMSGCKSTSLEGGIRVPLFIKWPNNIKSGSSNALVANYDFMATMNELLSGCNDSVKDGVSYLPVLMGKESEWNGHEYIVCGGEHGPSLITKDGWKIRCYITDEFKFGQFGAFWHEVEGQVIFELYNLKNDYKEEINLSKQYPEKLDELQSLLLHECDGNVLNGTTQAHFAFYGYNYKK